MLLVSSTQRICHQRRPQRQSQGSNGHIPFYKTGFSKFGTRLFDKPLVPGGRFPLQSFGHSGKARWIEPSASNSGVPRPTPVKNSRNGCRLRSVHFVEVSQNQTRKSERTLVERFDRDNRCAV